MSPLTRLMHNDVRMLVRSGYIWASVAVFGLLLLIATQATRLDFAGYEHFAASLILFDVVLSPVMLVGLMVLLERDEGAFAVLSVSRAPNGAYMMSKVAVVSAISLAQTLGLVMIAYDASLSPILLIVGLVGAASLAALFGFVIVALFDELYAFLLPMIATIVLLGAPGYGVLTGVDPDWLAWHPTTGSMTLIAAAFQPTATNGLILPIALTGAWLIGAAVFAHAAIRRIRSGEGGA